MWGRRALVAFVGAAVLGAAVAPGAAGYDAGYELFFFQDHDISESSGVVSSSTRDDLWFTHNDSGDGARLFAVDEQGCTVARIAVGGAEAVDWEDIAAGPGPDGGRWLYVGDIGDNLHQRASIQVYGLPEPAIGGGAGGPSLGCAVAAARTVASEAYELVYPDHPHDAETLLADPADGRLYVVTKTPFAQSSVYRAPLPLSTGGPNRLELVGTVVFGPSATYERLGTLDEVTPFDVAGRLMAVGGDVAPDRDRVVIRTYTDAWEWDLAAGQDLATALLAPPRQVPLPWTRQGEAITYTRDGTGLLTTCEDPGCPAHLLAG